MKILNAEIPTPAEHTDDAIAVLLVIAYVAGLALEGVGYGFTIPVEVLMFVLGYALKGGVAVASGK